MTFTLVGVLADGSGTFTITGFHDAGSAAQAGEDGVAIGWFSSYVVREGRPSDKNGPNAN